MKKKIGYTTILFAALIALPVLAQAETTDEAVIQTIQSEVDIAKSKADKNAAEIENMKGGIPQAIAAEAAAREAAVSAEASARAAEDAALSAAISAEELARISADRELQHQLDTHAILLEGLDNRVSVLEGLDLGRSVTWIETSEFDVVDMANAAAGLNASSGDWVLVTGKKGRNGQEWSICTDSSNAIDWLSNMAASTSFYSYTRMYINIGNGWLPNYTVYMSTGDVGYSQYMRVAYPATGSPVYQTQVNDRKGNTSHINAEVFVRYYYSGENYPGNEVTINVDTTRLEACGF